MTFAEIGWQGNSGLPLLTLLQLTPALFALFIIGLRHWRYLASIIAVIAVVTEMFLAIFLYLAFDLGQPLMQFAEHWPLLGYHAAIDGISMLFILLTAFLSLMLILYVIARDLEETPRLFYILLFTTSVVMVLFTTMNLFWFFLFSALELVLAGYLMSHWASSPEKDQAKTRFMQFMSTGLLLFGLGIIMLAWNHADATSGIWSFDLFDLASIKVSEHLATIIFFMIFYGLAIRTPLFPLHGWLPVVATHGNVALAPTLLLGLKVGIYGMIRFMLPLVPEAVQVWQPYVVAFAVTGVFYAAILAFMQKNMRRLLSFAVISHTSILVIGLFSLGPTAYQGSVLLAINFGMATTGLLFMSGFVFRRTNSMLLSHLGGLFDTIPFIGAAFLVAGLAIVGMPGTPGFDAAHLILESSMKRFGALITVVAALGNVLAAGFLLWAFQRAFLTPALKPMDEQMREPTRMSERLVALLIIVVLISTGFYSDPWLELLEPASVKLDQAFQPS